MFAKICFLLLIFSENNKIQHMNLKKIYISVHMGVGVLNDSYCVGCFRSKANVIVFNFSNSAAMSFLVGDSHRFRNSMCLRIKLLKKLKSTKLLG